MAVTHQTLTDYSGLSTDGKATTDTADGARFYETDSFHEYVYAGGTWRTNNVAASDLTDLLDVGGTPGAGDFIKHNGGSWLTFDLFGTANTWTGVQSFTALTTDISNTLEWQNDGIIAPAARTGADGYALTIQSGASTDQDGATLFLYGGTGGALQGHVQIGASGAPSYVSDTGDLLVGGLLEVNDNIYAMSDIVFDGTSNCTLNWDNTQLILDKHLRVSGTNQLRFGNGTGFMYDLTGTGYLVFTGTNLLYSFSSSIIMGATTGTTLGGSVGTNTTTIITGTGTVMDFKVGSTSEVQLSADALYPAADYAYDLGTSTKRYDRLYHHDYLSLEVDSDSTASAAEYDAFDEDNYAAFAKTDNVTPQGITYTQADGKFTVDQDGIFLIMITFILQTTASALTNLIIRYNGGSDHTVSVYVHASVDPVERTVIEMKSMSSGDYLNFLVDSQAAGTITVKAGTHANILRFS